MKKRKPIESFVYKNPRLTKFFFLSSLYNKFSFTILRMKQKVVEKIIQNADILLLLKLQGSSGPRDPLFLGSRVAGRGRGPRVAGPTDAPPWAQYNISQYL
jgi:hypothetical protein